MNPRRRNIKRCIRRMTSFRTEVKGVGTILGLRVVRTILGLRAVRGPQSGASTIRVFAICLQGRPVFAYDMTLGKWFGVPGFEWFVPKYLPEDAQVSWVTQASLATIVNYGYLNATRRRVMGDIVSP